MEDQIPRKTTLPGYRHIPGRHCGSTALSNWFRYFGLELDEAMSFGLGAGLGFAYVESPMFSPSHMVMTRAAQLEINAWEHLGIPQEVRHGADAWAVWESNKRMLDQGIPIIISCDLAYLPYWNTKTKFNGHRVTIVGYDDETKTAQIADTHHPGLQSVGYDALIASRTSTGPPLMSSDSLYHHVEKPGPTRPLAQAISLAIRRQAAEILDPPLGERAGPSGLRLLAAHLPEWKEAKDAKWCHRFSYQVIEKRGTGGAGFRTLYREFLEQAERLVPAVAQLELTAGMRKSEAGWKSLAAEFYRHSELASPGDTAAASDLAMRLADLEENWAKRARRI